MGFRNPQVLSSTLAAVRSLQPRAFGFLNRFDPLVSVSKNNPLPFSVSQFKSLVINSVAALCLSKRFVYLTPRRSCRLINQLLFTLILNGKRHLKSPYTVMGSYNRIMMSVFGTIASFIWAVYLSSTQAYWLTCPNSNTLLCSRLVLQ